MYIVTWTPSWNRMKHLIIASATYSQIGIFVKDKKFNQESLFESDFTASDPTITMRPRLR